MTPEESEMLQDLLGRVRQTRLAEKDPDAQVAIDRAIGANPDAHYILSQMVLVQKIALVDAKLQNEQLQQKVAGLQQHLQERPVQPARTTSFLGSLLGKDDASPRAASPSRVQPAGAPFQPVSASSEPLPYQPPRAAPPSQPVQGYATVPGAFNPYGGGGVGGAGFLRSAATTAAGVAAGALAFEGVESLLHGGRGYGGLGGGFAGGAAVEENINNYYDGTGRAAVHHPHDEAIDHPGVVKPGQDPHLVAASYEPSARDSGASSLAASYDINSLGGEGVSEYERPNSYPAGGSAAPSQAAGVNAGERDPGDREAGDRDPGPRGTADRDLAAPTPDDGVPADQASDVPLDDSSTEGLAASGEEAGDAFGGDVYDGGGASVV